MAGVKNLQKNASAPGDALPRRHLPQPPASSHPTLAHVPHTLSNLLLTAMFFQHCQALGHSSTPHSSACFCT